MARQPIIVGFGSKARMGKGTAAKAIVAAYPQYDIREYGFADALKREVNEMDAFAECLRLGLQYDHNTPQGDPFCTSRHGKQSRLLQYYGENRRAQDAFYWVKKLHQTLEADQPQFALITDLRYQNEYLYVKSRAGYTVRCTRLGFVDLSRDPNHVSETQLDNAAFDFEVTVQDSEEGMTELKKDAAIIFQMILDELNPTIPNIEELVLGS